MLTLEASTIDRRFIDKVILGNGKTLVGNAINGFQMNGSIFPLVFGKEVTDRCNEHSAK
ncbi:Subtilisin-like protease [Actinidia chinensis var. chinensis]|uniref:Subtilisin-like protease n=1 Tax=Actinidia chinensis var. chinensis TaxID=1590841 RepID=A0A2R6PBG8_ACTCC|nr:Subtilisin-like protease [Actinidia chinensis var. chinensis]